MTRAPRVVYTAGVFDLLHRGHLNILWQSKQLGDILIVGVVTSDGVEAYKGRSPVQEGFARQRQVQALPFVDAAVVQLTTDPTPNLERYLPDVMTHADGADDWSHLKAQVEALGIEYVNLPYTAGISTTALREKASRDRPLAYDYELG